MPIFPLTATPEQVKRVSQGETVELLPARDGYRVVLREVEGQVVAEYVDVCDADHCAVEERAVIDAALRWYEWVDQLRKLSDAEVDLVNTVSALRHRRTGYPRAK